MVGRARRPDAVAFDMDGVLFDSEPLHFQTLNSVLAREGIGVSEAENRELLGLPVEEVVAEVLQRRGLSRDIRPYMASYDDEIVRLFNRQLVAAAGARELLEKLVASNLRLAVASSSKRAWIGAALEAVGLAGFFAEIASAEEVAHGKPAPDVYVLAAQRLGASPGRMVAVEDSPAGVMAAKRAGMKVLGVRTPYTRDLPLPGADKVVAALTDLDITDFETSSDWAF